ncbi:hypothetical protein PR001_g24148 [Phytophthora rubi]|uniref:Chromo domain-containing protein n=1 Tax=Phytophthora rubi TaxID=129364 RepID=A0A6A3IF74_9STRA|nr:hypothetical protein PR001_g24148 [Phytophthora rubi]
MAPRKANRTLDNAFSATDKAAGGQRHRGRGRKQIRNDASALPAPKTRRKTQLAANKQNERCVEDDDSDESDEGDIYEVETILKEQGGRFYVKWAGYDSDENTWEPERNLKPEMIKRFRNRAAGVPRLNTAADTASGDSDEEPCTATAVSDASTAAELSVDSIIGAHVSFSPLKEEWMSATDYARVGSAYLIGVISREYVEKGKRKKKHSGDAALFELRWTTTQYQTNRHVHGITRTKVLEGIANYNRLNGNELRADTWEVLCRPYHEEASGADLWDEFEAVSEDCARYDCRETIPEDVGEVERVSAMDFRAAVSPPDELFGHGGGLTSPQVKSEFEFIFQHSASSSFLAYLSLAFWKKVVSNTNVYSAGQKRSLITLDELMKFLGVLFYMALVDKGEYANYWGEQVEDTIFDAQSVRLDPIMSLDRFKFIRKNLCFRDRISKEALQRDPAARIRPLMNMLKLRASKFVALGRNVAVDESSIACRSRFARHLIVFNATKPTGKYHFK